MNLSLATDYALRIVFDFSRLDAGRYLTTDEIAVRASIPQDAVGDILQRLEKAGIIVAPGAAGGGYRLARPRREISLHDVIAAMEENVFLTHCLRSTSLCNAARAPECKVHRALGVIQNNLIRDLRAFNFGNL